MELWKKDKMNIMKFALVFVLVIIPVAIISQDLTGCIFMEEGAIDFYGNTKLQDIPDVVYEHALNTFYSMYSENYSKTTPRQKLNKEEAKERVTYLGQIKDPFKEVNIYHFENGFLAGSTVPFVHNTSNDSILNPKEFSRNKGATAGFNRAYIFLLNELIEMESLKIDEVVLKDLFNILALVYSLERFYRINGNEELDCLADFWNVEMNDKITSQLKEPSILRNKDQLSYTAQILFGQKRLHSFTLIYDFKKDTLLSSSKYIGDIHN